MNLNLVPSEPGECKPVQIRIMKRTREMDF